MGGMVDPRGRQSQSQRKTELVVEGEDSVKDFMDFDKVNNSDGDGDGDEPNNECRGFFSMVVRLFRHRN
ncbi:hypothetical protein VNO77_23397 [Canavalia gladiata]|uniref:Uncharacterized protein n=1 Tax=Canavalia gladiata TaxID=3824 RepID=A0AAN9L4C7_CANGL